MAKRRIIFVSVVFFSLTVFTVQTLPRTRSSNRTVKSPDRERLRFGAKVADRLNVRWRSIAYKKTLYNPAIPPENRGQKTPESLLLSCEIEIPEPGLVLSTSPEAIVEKITDSQGQDIDVGLEPSRSMPMYMGNLFSVMRRRTLLGTARPPAGRSTKSEHSTLRVELDPGLRERVRGEIGQLEGHFGALIAESVEYVEVPFKANDNWVRLTPDVEIRVLEARNEASMYRYNIEQRPENVPHLVGVRIGDYLPSRLVVGRQFLGQRSAAGAGGGTGEVALVEKVPEPAGQREFAISLRSIQLITLSHLNLNTFP